MAPPLPPFIYMLATSPLAVLVPALLLRRWRAAPVATDAWDPRIDTALLGVAAIGGAIAMAWGTARASLTVFPFTASDFVDYCESLAPIRSGDFAHVHRARSVAAGALPAFLAPEFGTIGGLAAAALIATVVTCGAIWLAGRALHSRTAGFAAVIVAAALPPIALLPRTVSFYPEIVASLALCAALPLAMIRFRSPLSALATGLAVASTLVLDGRGLFFAVPAGALALATALAGSRRWLLAALVVVPIAASWPIAGRLSAHTTSVEDQAAAMNGDALRFAGADPSILMQPTPAERFRWGIEPLTNLPRGIRYLAHLADQVKATAATSPEVQRAAERTKPWGPVLVASGVIVALGLRRRPELLVGLACAAIPAAAAIRQALAGVPHVRMLAPGAPIVATLAGVAFAAVLGGALERRGTAPDPPRISVRTAIALGILGMMVAGAFPSWLGPRSSWRGGDLGDDEPRRLLTETEAGTFRPGGGSCQDALRRDAQTRGTMYPLWYGRAPPAPQVAPPDAAPASTLQGTGPRGTPWGAPR